MADTPTAPEFTEDDFELAFAAASEDASIPAKEVTSELPPAASSEEPPAAASEPEVTDPPAGGAKPDPPTPEPKVEKPPEPAPTPTPDPVAEAAAKKAADDATAAAKLAADEAAAREDLSEDEKTALTDVVTNFPEVATLIQAVQRTTFAKAENAFAAKIAELERRLTQQMAPALQTAQTVAHSAFETAVLKEHSDAFTVLPKVEEWIATKPKFLQDAYNKVLDSSTAQETIQLLSLFKQETGSAQPDVTSDKVKQENNAADEAKRLKDKKLTSMEGVRSRQTATKSSIDEDDFEGAFNMAANS
jgi:hypothetical protein